MTSDSVERERARVAQASHDCFVVRTADGEFHATVSGALRHGTKEWPCVGDWVVLRGSQIIEILPRRTKLSRRAPGKETHEQVLAANMDVLFVVTGLDRDYNPRRLERYLVLAHESGARPVVLLNKADLRPNFNDIIQQTRCIAPGIPIFALSALEGWGLDAVPSELHENETAALIGSSGAGKSTILNRLLGSERQLTGPVRDSDERGRHITTRRELIAMPGGWLMMDLPGLRELQLWADPEQIDQAFSDIAELALECRFRDCIHDSEPGCAVRAAQIDERRLASFQKLKRELDYMERQRDANLARETKKRWKAIHKAMRTDPKRRGLP